MHIPLGSSDVVVLEMHKLNYWHLWFSQPPRPSNQDQVS